MATATAGQLDLLNWHDAEFSEDRVYRYRLTRRWNHGPRLVVIGLNPSTADETQDDPTVRRCIGYARDWGFAGLVMMNLFAYRATDPRELLRFTGNPIGEDRTFGIIRNRNHSAISCEVYCALLEGGAVLAAWGAHGAHREESTRARWLLQKDCDRAGRGHGIACLGLTAKREPRHPLYQPRDAKPMPFIGNGGRLCEVTQ